MIDLDDELVGEYLADRRKHMSTAGEDLLAIEDGGSEIDVTLVNRVFRAVHTVRGVGFFDLTNISELARRTEDVLMPIRSRAMVPSKHRVRVLLRATGRLQELIQKPGASNQASIAEIMDDLDRLLADHMASGETKPRTSVVDRARRGGERLRVLLVEDDVASQLLLQTFLSRYGECHVAVNGREAVEAVRSSLEQGPAYDLICMDIMMPEMDGREAVRQVRALEEAHGTFSNDGVKIVMTTTVDDIGEVTGCFLELCNAYLMKPIDLAQLLSQMKSYRMVQKRRSARPVLIRQQYQTRVRAKQF
jgi:two-component system chemotaxis response regulator CheY